MEKENRTLMEEKIKVKIAEKLHYHRKKNHLSQEAVATHIGRSKRTISRHENADFEDINIGQLLDYAECYGVSLFDLLPTSPNPSNEETVKLLIGKLEKLIKDLKSSS